MGDQLARDAENVFTKNMAKLKAYPIMGEALNVSKAIGDQSIAYAKAVISIGELYGIGNLKVDPAAVQTFVQQEVLGIRPPPIPIQTKYPATSAADDTNPATMPETDYRNVAWLAACTSFCEPEPEAKLRIRRNAILKYRNLAGGNSATIVTPGDESGVIAHGFEEMHESALDVGTAHDQFLSQIHACQIAKERMETVMPPIHSQFIVPGIPTVKAKEDLDAYVLALKKRYGIQ